MSVIYCLSQFIKGFKRNTINIVTFVLRKDLQLKVQPIIKLTANIIIARRLYLMLDTKHPEYTSPKTKIILNTNRSTGQLIPACRAQILKAKRQNLCRKINQVADQIFNLKYDTEYQIRELHKLTEKGQQLFQIAQVALLKVKTDIKQSLNSIHAEDFRISLNLQTIQNKKCQISDRSTQISAITQSKELSLPESQMNVKIVTERKQIRRNYTLNFTQSKAKPLDMKKLSISQTLLKSRFVENSNTKNNVEKKLRTEQVKKYPIEGIFIILFGITVIILLI